MVDKKVFVLLFFVLLFSFVLSANDASEIAGSLEGDVQGIQDAVENFPLDSEGNVDYDKYNIYRSKLEKRIDGWNLWIEENASWLEFIFGMVPEVSLLFFVNFFVWFTLFYILVLNVDLFYDLWGFLRKGFGFVTFGRVIGVVVFYFAMETGSIFFVAEYLEDGVSFFWNYGWIIAVIATVIIVVLAFFFPGIVLRIITGLVSGRKRRKEVSRNERAEDNDERIDALTEEVIRLRKEKSGDLTEA